MKEIEEGLYQIHAEARQKKEETAMEEATPPTDDQQSRLSPFLVIEKVDAVSYTHLRAHETSLHLVCRLLLEKKGVLAGGYL